MIDSHALTPRDLSMFAKIGVGPELLVKAKVKRVDDREARDLLAINGRSGDAGGIFFPYLSPQTGRRVAGRVRRDKPEIEDGEEKNKYLASYGDRRHLYFTPKAIDALSDPTIPIVLVEAEKSALALYAWSERTGKKILPVAMGGCWGWRGRIGKVENASGERVDETGPLPELRNCANRPTYILLDANCATNPKVQEARKSLVSNLKKMGAQVRVLDLPGGDGINGPDDFLAVRGDEALEELLDAVVPEPAGEKKKLATHKVANWKTCEEVRPETLVFLWPQRVPLKFGTAFLGDPDMGKSLLSLDLMARLSRGNPFLDGAENVHGPVESILLSTEDDPNTIIVPRLMAAGADLKKIHLVDTVRMFDAEEELEEERQLTLESDLSVIREKINSNPAIKLLVIDPLSNYLGSRNLMKEQEIRSVLMPVVTMAQDLSIAVIVIMHHSKTEGRSAMHKAIGAVGAVGCLRMAWSFVKSQDDENIREMLQSKKNLGKFPGLRFATETAKVKIGTSDTEQALIKYLDVSNASIENVLAAQEDREGRQDNRAAAFLRENLPKDGTHHSDDIIQKAKEQRISSASLFRARKELGITTEKITNQWFWSWPTEAY